MKECTKCGEEKALTEFGKRADSKDGLMGMCKQCNRARVLKWQKENPEKVSAKQKRSDSKPDNAKRKAESTARWQRENKEKLAAKSKRYNSSPKGRATGRARCMKRHAAKLQRRPSWANDQLIAAYYKEAKRLEELTGIQFHVDHIIPLQGELVSGLHVETNLQLLPAHENIGKSNRFDPASFCA